MVSIINAVSASALSIHRSSFSYSGFIFAPCRAIALRDFSWHHRCQVYRSSSWCWRRDLVDLPVCCDLRSSSWPIQSSKGTWVWQSDPMSTLGWNCAQDGLDFLIWIPQSHLLFRYLGLGFVFLGVFLVNRILKYFLLCCLRTPCFTLSAAVLAFCLWAGFFPEDNNLDPESDEWTFLRWSHLAADKLKSI